LAVDVLLDDRLVRLRTRRRSRTGTRGVRACGRGHSGRCIRGAPCGTAFERCTSAEVVGVCLYGCGVQMRDGYRIEPTPGAGLPQPVGRKPRARKRPKRAPTHVRSWPLRLNPAQCRDIRTRFFTGTRVYNAVLGEFLARSRTVKADPAWQTARRLPRTTPARAGTARKSRSPNGSTAASAGSQNIGTCSPPTSDYTSE